MKKYAYLLIIGVALSHTAFANGCRSLPKAAELKAALTSVAKLNDLSANGGVGAPVWLVEVNTKGTVCAVVHSLENGVDVTTELALNHRILAAQKAAIANGFSRTALSVSSANIYFGSQSGEIASGMNSFLNSTFNPNAGNTSHFGTRRDPLVGQRMGGGAAEPGGLALFDANQKKVGAIGVSGDFRCTDHVIAWKVREILRDGAYSSSNVIGLGLSARHDDALTQDVGEDGKSASGFGYFKCFNNPTDENDGDSILGN
jgi:hypothetical protein